MTDAFSSTLAFCAHPFLRWAGGKTRLLPELISRLPEKFVGYHEPFVGGGALFWKLAETGWLKKGGVYLSDLNEHLVRTYCGVKDHVENAIYHLQSFPVTEQKFYALRAIRPDDPNDDALTDAALAAWFIFLNKTCFNGLYRANKSGGFNVPWGKWKKSPLVCDEANLRACSEVLRSLRVSLKHQPFQAIRNVAKPGDLVYFDSPYAPVSPTGDFTSYTKEGFGYEDQVRLRDVARELKERGVYVMLSNSDVPVIRELYGMSRGGFKIDVVEASRSINSKGTGRGAVRELIIR